jgi:molybdenum cofactor guanylyltransferase
VASTRACRTTAASLQQFIQSGQRKVDRWTDLHRHVEVVFDDAAAFDNANTAAELRRLQG